MVEIQLSAEYLRNRPTYDMIADFEDGDEERVEHYLIRYASESPDTHEGKKAYAGRRERLFNENMVRPYLEVHHEHMSQPIDFNVPTGERWEEIIADVTQFGVSAEEMCGQVLYDYCRDGLVGVLVDQQATVPSSAAQAQAVRSRSYQIKYNACEILNWERFTLGRHKGKLSKLLLNNGITTVNGKRHVVLRQYEMSELGDVTWQDYLADEKFKADKSGKVKVTPGSKGAVGIKEEIPFAMLGTGPRNSFCLDNVRTNRAFLNRYSVRDNINHHQGFKKSIIFGNNVKQEDLKVMAENTMTIIPDTEASLNSIDAGDPVAITAQLAEMRVLARRQGMKEHNQLADDTKNVQSSESKAKDVKGRVKLYNKTVDSTEVMQTKVYRFHAMFEGLGEAEVKKVTVAIGRDYGLDDEAQEAADDQQNSSMAGSLGARLVQKKILKKRISEQRFVPEEGKTEEDIRKECYDDIDNAEVQSELSQFVSATRPSLAERLSA